MTTSGPGYFITLTGFLPADPQDIESMTKAVDGLRDFRSRVAEFEKATGLADIEVAHRFVMRRKVAEAEPPDPAAPPSGPPPPPGSTEPTPEPQASVPADGGGTVAAPNPEATDKGGDLLEIPGFLKRPKETAA